MAQGVTIDFNANVARFSSAIDKATADLNKFQTNADRMAKNVKGAFGGLAAGLSVAAFTAYGKSVIDAADKLQDLSDRTNVSVKDLASLDLAAKLADTSIESVGKAVARLNLSFSQAQGGNKEVNEALKRLGVTSTDAKERFFQLADAYERAGGQGRVLDDIQKVLGKSYVELIPLIQQGGDALRDAAKEAESFADAMVRLSPGAANFNDELDKLNQSLTTFAAKALPPLVAGFNILLDKLNGGTGNDPFEDYLTWLGEATKRQKELNLAQEKFGEGSTEYKFAERALQIAQDKLKQYQNAAAADQKDTNKTAATSGTSLPPTQTTPKTDPLAGFFKATDTARLKEYSSLTADLLRRMAGAKGDTSIYVQALDEINKKFADLVLQQQQFDLGGGVMGDFDDLQSYQEALNEARAEQQAYNDTLIASGRAIEEQFGNPMDGLTERLAYLDWLLEQGKISFEAWGNAGLDATEKAAAAMGDVTANTQDQFADLKNAIEGWSRDAAQAMVDFAITGESSVTDMVNGILAQLARMTAQKYITDPLFNAIGSMLPDLVPNADGGVYSAPGLSAYSGTVVSQPTVFPFARGIGLMGEAGPEAILPLTRVNGKLGVQAQGGGSGDVQVNVYNAPAGTSATVKESVDSRGARKIDIVLSEIVGAELRRPGSPANSAIRQGFGVRPTIIRR